MKQLPLLTDFGLGLPYGTPLSHRSAKMKEEKLRLLGSEKRFEAVCDWLNDIKKTKFINNRHTSYFLKHLAENRLGLGHISNGTLIAAAIYCGFNYKSARNHPNLVFNMSQDSIQKKYEESLLYQKYPNNHLFNGGQMNSNIYL